MMANSSPQIRITGVKEVLRKLDGDKARLSKNMNDAIHQAGFFLQSEVKASIAGERAEPASVDTGHFLQSVETDNSEKFKSVVKSEVEYAQYLEYGTSKIAPRRHFRNSSDRNASKINSFVKDSLSK